MGLLEQWLCDSSLALVPVTQLAVEKSIKGIGKEQ